MTDRKGPIADECFGELLSGYLDGELTQQDRQRVELRLAESEECARMLRELEDLRERMGILMANGWQ